MGLFDRIENKIEGVVNSVFARGSRDEVLPIEISTRLQRELDAEAKLMSRDKKLVPNDFTVLLSTYDYERLVPFSKTMNSEIIPDLRQYAAERHYVFNGPISISYDLDESLPLGRFQVASAALAGVETAGAPPSTTMIRRSKLVLEVNGVRHPLLPPGLTIGRGTEADLRINDPGVSRKHAQITVSNNSADDDDLSIVIEDLGSTNGIVVNGSKVRKATLDDGSRIEIGSTRMLVHSPTGV